MNLAFEFASFAHGDNEAYLCLDSGDILYFSEFGDCDPRPEDFDDSDRYLAVPNKHDLDLGRSVVFDFVNTHAAHLYDDVRDIFSRPGAYGNFKTLLCQHNLDGPWHAFENDRETSEIRVWCRELGIALDDDG